LTTDLTTNARPAAARSLHEICVDTSRATCGECWAPPGDECVYTTVRTTVPVSVPVTKGTPVRPVRGYHVAWFARAERRGLISAADFAAVLDMAVVFTAATVIYDEPGSPPEVPERGGIGPGPGHLLDRRLIGPEDQVGALPDGTAACTCPDSGCPDPVRQPPGGVR
jgi:hypothetical protein